MKKIFILTFALAASALTYQGCSPVDNTKAWRKADSLANLKLMVLKDSLHNSCMDSVMAWAMMRSDSLMAANMKTGGTKKGGTTTKSTEGTVSDREGATGPKSTTDRKGTTDTSGGGPKSVKDRKGAQPPPPKQ